MKLFHLLASLTASLLVNVSIAAAQEKLRAFNTFNEKSVDSVDHGQWDGFLKNYVHTEDDRRTVVDYSAVSDADRKTVKSYIATLEEIDPTTLNRNEAFAYWVNLYNALTVDIILDNYPLKSIRNLRSGLRPGPWQRNLAAVNNVDLTLDNIEHGILRKFWADNRVHYAVNCASIGCPNLADRAYETENLNDMLNQAAHAYINHPRGVRVEGDKIIASSIYNWFKKDFGGDDAGVIAHLQQYAEPDLKNALSQARKITKYEYDWRLNDIE